MRTPRISARSFTRLPAKRPPNGQRISFLRVPRWQKINSLIEMGFIQAQPGRIVALHPLVQEIALEELNSSIQSCHILLNSLHEICLRHGEETPHMKVCVICNTKTIRKEEVAFHFFFFSISRLSIYSLQRLKLPSKLVIVAFDLLSDFFSSMKVSNAS